MSKRKIILILVLTLLCALAWWLYSRLEWQEKIIDLGYTSTANSYPFLAAQSFLTRYDIDVEQRRGFSLIDTLNDEDSLVAQDDTLIVIDGYRAIDSQRQKILFSWVREGGSLFLSSRNASLNGGEEGLSDPIFSSLGVTVFTDETFPDYTSELYSNPGQNIPNFNDNEDLDIEEILQNIRSTVNPSWCPESSLPISNIKDEEGNTPLQMQFNGNRRLLFDSAQYQTYRDSRGSQMLFAPYGKGQIVLSTDNQIWSNRRIGCHDHAYQLWSLSTGNKVWFMLNTESNSVFNMIWRFTPVGCSLLLLWLGLFIWNKSRRLGPLIPVEYERKRSFLEHLQASANFLWATGQHQKLITRQREEVLLAFNKEHAGFNSLSPAQQQEKVQLLTQLPQTLIEQSLFSEIPKKMNTSVFEQRIRTLQMIYQLI